MNKKKVIFVRLTEEEKAAIQAVAKRLGRSVSNYVLYAALEYARSLGIPLSPNKAA